MANLTIVLPLLIAFLSILHPSCFRTMVTGKIVLPLIHRDSIFSPVYRPNYIIPVPLVVQPDYMFLVNFSIGEPPVPQLMLMDGGSSFIWVCNKCNNAYNHLKSSTYSRIRCRSDSNCKVYNAGDKCMNSDCTYAITYGDNSMSQGYLAEEQFTFHTSRGTPLQIRDILFGRATRMTKWLGPRVGIFGLEPLGKHSLTASLGGVYSYCIGNISDPYYKFNELRLGADGARIYRGSQTPLKFLEGHYVVNFRGITVDGKVLNIDGNELGYNMLIDSGTPLTWLRKSVYDLLRSRVEEILRQSSFEDPETDLEEMLCYDGNLVRDLKGFPRVILSLEDHEDNAANVELNLGEESLFWQNDTNRFCLAVVPVKEPDGITILGTYAQQYHNFGFDMNTEVVNFEDVDCEYYDDSD